MDGKNSRLYLRVDGQTYLSEENPTCETPITNPIGLHTHFVDTVTIWEDDTPACNLNLLEYQEFISVTENRENLLQLLNMH